MKQYLMLCDEVGMAQLKAIFRSEAVQFLEVQGMGLNGANQTNILVTPIIPPVNPMPAPAVPQQPVNADAPEQPQGE